MKNTAKKLSVAFIAGAAIIATIGSASAQTKTSTDLKCLLENNSSTKANVLKVSGKNCDIKDIVKSGKICDTINKKPNTNKPNANNSNTNNGNTNKPNANNGNTNNGNTNNGTTNNGNNSSNTNKPAEDNTTVSGSESVKTIEAEVAKLVNEERAKAGLKALTLDSNISNVARTKSQDMADKNYFNHTSPTYGSPFDMMKKFGISYKTAGENIAMGQPTAKEVMKDWMNSPGHKANILSSDFGKIGVGYVVKNGTAYWTQMFTN